MDNIKVAKFAVDNIVKEGLTDIFTRPFEVDLLSNIDFRKKVLSEITKSLNANSFEGLGVNCISHVLLPKNSAFDFRRSALIQPMDTLKYTALVLTIADVIEQHRIPVSEKKVFSYRFKYNKGYLFNKNYTLTAFQNYAREKAKRKKTNVIVSCDIANFYDRLNLHRLENILYSIGCEKNRVKSINELLLFWSNRDSYGLPVGSNASRILAEASLIGVDQYLKSIGVDFIRFVDDYRLFAPDVNTAHYWLTILIERLWQEGLTINKSKTKIEASHEYRKTMGQTNNLNEKHCGKKEKNPFKIQAGYGGTVPNKFRQLSKKEIDYFRQINLEEKIKDIASKDFIEADEIIELVKIIVSQTQFNQLINVIGELDKYPQLTTYVIDALVKHSSVIDLNTREAIKTIFTQKLIENKYIPEYILLAIIRLFGHNEFSNKEILLRIFRELKRNSGVYIGRALLDSLENNITREDALEIRNSFERSNSWEKRQIVRIICKKLIEEEKRPWLKNIKSIETSDLFLQEIANPTKKQTKRSKK